MKPTFTIGIEEEYQTIDPVTRDLRSHIHSEIIAKGKLRMEERIKAEMHQSVVEVGTGVCKNIKDAKAEVRQLRTEMVKLAHENGLLLAAGAMHRLGDVLGRVCDADGIAEEVRVRVHAQQIGTVWVV